MRVCTSGSILTQLWRNFWQIIKGHFLKSVKMDEEVCQWKQEYDRPVRIREFQPHWLVVTVIVIILVIVFVWPFDILWDRILSILNVLHLVIKVQIRSYILQILQTPFVTWYSSHSNIVSQWGWNSLIRTGLSYSCFHWHNIQDWKYPIS
jgi:hypothetical protein